MSNDKGMGTAEVKIGVGLIGVLLALLAVVIVQRSHRQLPPDEVVVDRGKAFGDGEVIPAEFHTAAVAPTVLEPRSSQPPPIYADRQSPAMPPTGLSPAGRPANPLTRTGDASAPRDFLPRLPVTRPPEEHANEVRGPSGEPLQHAPVAVPLQSQPSPASGPDPMASQLAPAEDPYAADDSHVLESAPATTHPEAEDPVPSPTPAVARMVESPQPDTADPPPSATDGPTPLPAREPHPAAVSAADPSLPTSPPTAPETATRWRDRYSAESGDSMWSISKRVYGTGTFFKALAEHNRDRIPTPERLVEGDQVLTPKATLLYANYPKLCPRVDKEPIAEQRGIEAGGRSAPTTGRKYLVEEGDTLGDIARYELGDANRWAELYQLNRSLVGSDPDYIRPGTWLVLPTGTRPRVAVRPVRQSPAGP